MSAWIKRIVAKLNVIENDEKLSVTAESIITSLAEQAMDRKQSQMKKFRVIK